MPGPTEYAVGEPDPTWTAPLSRYCGARSPSGWFCTWPDGHDGPHVAGDDDGVVLGVWT